MRAGSLHGHEMVSERAGSEGLAISMHLPSNVELMNATNCWPSFPSSVGPTIVLAYMMMASARADKYLPLNKATAFLQVRFGNNHKLAPLVALSDRPHARVSEQKKEPGCMPSRNDQLLQQLIDLEAEL